MLKDVGELRDSSMRIGTMADQPPEEIYLRHVRASDYKEISADGTLHKIVDSHLIITFYIEDSIITGEVLKRE